MFWEKEIYTAALKTALTALINEGLKAYKNTKSELSFGFSKELRKGFFTIWDKFDCY